MFVVFYSTTAGVTTGPVNAYFSDL
jgi:hypothetical protein